ncbi:MAG: TlpA disulfide reductase family protein [Candidatus Sericytochromatia bacterium]
MKKLIPVVLGVALLAGGLTMVQNQSAEATKPANTKMPTLGKAADFNLTSIEGKKFSLADFKGKVVILDFWATWCPPCREEIPDFIALQKQYRSQGLEIVGVSVDREGPSVVKKFGEEYGINYTSLMADDKVTAAYGGIRGLPTTFVIDRQGNIIKKYVGAQPKATFEKDVKALL